MLTRATAVILFISLCIVGGSPSHPKPKKAASTSRAQDPPLVLSTRTASQPGSAKRLAGDGRRPPCTTNRSSFGSARTPRPDKRGLTDILFSVNGSRY